MHSVLQLPKFAAEFEILQDSLTFAKSIEMFSGILMDEKLASASPCEKMKLLHVFPETECAFVFHQERAQYESGNQSFW